MQLGAALAVEVQGDVEEGRRSPEASRVATLLDWTVRDDWRNAPEVLWFRTEADLMAWAVFLRRALPAALGWLSRAHLDRSHLALRLWFDEL